MYVLSETNDGIEDMVHFLLLCPSFDIHRRNLLAGISELLQPFVNINSLPNQVLVQHLLYGNKDFPDDVNKNVLKMTLKFIHEFGRFDKSFLS